MSNIVDVIMMRILRSSLIFALVALFPAVICAQEGDIYYEKLKKELPNFATVLMYNQV